MSIVIEQNLSPLLARLFFAYSLTNAVCPQNWLRKQHFRNGSVQPFVLGRKNGPIGIWRVEPKGSFERIDALTNWGHHPLLRSSEGVLV